MSEKRKCLAGVTGYDPANDKKLRRTSKKELNAYFKSYKNGLNDFHWPIFHEVKNIAEPKRVLYPGCHRHITASLVFSDIVYVDSYDKVASCYSDVIVLEWINEHKEYTDETKLKFWCKNFEHDFGEEEDSFDLIISMSAGIVSTHCSKYLRSGGYFLVSDAHYDARMMSLDKQFQLTHVWDKDKKCFLNNKEELNGHFTTTKNEKLTKAMVEESIDKPKAKRSFQLMNEALFYLFKKVST